MSKTGAEINLQTYGAEKTVAHYSSLHYLTPCERLLFETYIKPESAILDLGVGGGRTTAFLSAMASCYVGVDYVPAMIDACRKKFPGLEFMVASAADLSAFQEASFDGVVFAFNGIDFVLPDAARRRCFEHIHRVLKPGGVVIFSAHNARSIVVRPSWNRDRVKGLAMRLSGGSGIVARFWMTILTALRASLACVEALLKTVKRILGRVGTKTFWDGDGCLLDPAHGGLYTHYSIPSRVLKELDDVQLTCERILGDDYPRRSHPLATDWYYYVFSKPYPSKLKIK